MLSVTDVQTGQVQTIQTVQSHPTQIVVSSSGLFAATLLASQVIQLIDLRTCSCVAEIRPDNSDATAMVFTPDSRQLLIATSGKQILVWDTDSKQQIGIIKQISFVTTAMVFSGSNTLFCGGKGAVIESIGYNPVNYFIHQAADQFHHQQPITCSAISTDNQIMATASNDGKIRIWNTQSKQPLSELGAYSKPIKSMAYYEIFDAYLQRTQKLLVVAGDDKKIAIWDLETKECIKELDVHTDWVNALSITADFTFLASGSADKSVKILYLPTYAQRAAFTEHKGAVKCVCISYSQKWLASGSNDQTVILKSFQDLINNSPKPFTVVLQGHKDWVNAVAISRDDKFLASGSSDLSIKLWNLDNYTEIYSFSGHISDVHAVAFTPYNNYIISASSDKTIKLWNVYTKKLVQSLAGHTEAVNGFHYKEDQQALISYGADKAIKYWDLAQLELFQRIDMPVAQVQAGIALN